MQGTAVYRLITPKIFTRIEVATNAKLIQLKQIIEERTQVKPKDQKPEKPNPNRHTNHRTTQTSR